MDQTSIDQSGRLVGVARFPRLRTLAWSGDHLYASRGYRMMRARIQDPSNRLTGEPVAEFQPELRRRVPVVNRLTARLFRDGFHALAALPSGVRIAAVVGAIVTLRPGETEYSHHSPCYAPSAHHRSSRRPNLLGRVLR